MPYSSHRGYFKGAEDSGSHRYCSMFLACGIVSLRHGSHCKCIRTLTGLCRGEGRPSYTSCQKMKPHSSSQMPSTKPDFPPFLLSAQVEGINPVDSPPQFLFIKLSILSRSPDPDGSQLPHSLVTVRVFDVKFYSLILPEIL
jgi:hypothetical protein